MQSYLSSIGGIFMDIWCPPNIIRISAECVHGIVQQENAFGTSWEWRKVPTCAFGSNVDFHFGRPQKISACGCACFRPRHRLSDHQTRAQSISFNYNILEQGKIPNRNANDLSICAITSWSKKTFPTQMEMHPQIVAWNGEVKSNSTTKFCTALQVGVIT